MRTTLTLHDDVVALLDRVREGKDATFKDIVNEALRLGLTQMLAPPKRRQRTCTRVVSLGRPRVPDVDDVAEALAIAEGDAYS